MTRYQLLVALLHFIVFFLGAGIGSFLNVVIYRLPRGLSVNEPRRSFCPSCKYQIPWWRNIPVLSWLTLRGKCANCGAPISARYVGVEVLTGLLFYAVFRQFGGDWALAAQWGPQVLCLWVFTALLVAGTFIDIEHFILPHSITLGGTLAGLVCATFVPELVGQVTHLRGFLFSLGSGALGLGSLWLVVELGKLAFGRKKYRFDKQEAWSVTQPDDTLPPVVTLAGETYSWEDLFMRASDRLVISCARLKTNQSEWNNVTAELWMEKLKVRGPDGKMEEYNLEGVTLLEGTTSEVVIPREAMGFGDVLFLMMIGSFCGWQAVLFTILAASVLGTLVSGGTRLVGMAAWGGKLPFGPYLAAGAMLWIFYGPAAVAWYTSRLHL
ncbi:MAG TPA: prepilin peptidase [Verrucomicrobiales bacterium]|nr:prepilin peptidase [Verrucomicrobiales bacterium]